jgi:hypothetical protein
LEDAPRRTGAEAAWRTVRVECAGWADRDGRGAIGGV